MRIPSDAEVVSRRSGGWQQKLAPWAIGLLGLAVSLWYWQALLAQERRAVEAQLKLDVDEREFVIREALDGATKALHSVASFWGAAESVRRDQFEDFTTPLLALHPYVQAFGWDALVVDGQRENHEAEARAEGLADYQITERESQGKMKRAERRDEYVVVKYIEPLEGNEAALGFDVASESVRYEALARARDTGRLAITGRITLVQERRQQFGFLGFLPIYRAGPVSSAAERAANLEGFVVGVVRVATLVENALARLDRLAIASYVFDESAPADRQLLYAHASTSEREAPDEDAANQYSAIVELGGRRLRLAFVPTDVYLAGLQTGRPLVGLLVGLIMTVLVTAYMVQRQQSARVLAETEERLRLTLDAAVDGAWDWDLTTGEMFYSGSWLTSLGYERQDVEPHVHFWESIVHPEDMPGVKEILTEHLEGRSDAYECENRLRSSSGGYRWNLARGRVVARGSDGTPLRMVGTDTDISSRKRAEEEQQRIERQVLEAQNLESLGLLAGGIAHDFGNLLVGILGEADVALLDVAPDSPIADQLEQIKVAATRASELTRQILAYSGRGRFVVERLDLSGLVEEFGDLLRSSISKKAQLRYQPAEQPVGVEGDATQLRQVVMNLITNASDALGDRSGTISLSTSVTRVDRADLGKLILGEHIEPGTYACIQVSDTGAGIDAASHSLIFEPFFSTRSKGRGLGLAAALGIVRSHGGAIKVDSEPGRGTTIRVFLPLAGLPEESEERGAWTDADAPLGGGTVLVVDDEEAVRRVCHRMLGALGFRVLTAEDGQAGVEEFRRHADQIDVVLLDMTMPRMGGVEAFVEIRRIRPEARVILSSGYSEEAFPESLAERPAGFIQKPYKVQQLREKLRAVING